MLYEVSTSMPLQFLISFIVTTIPVMITSIVILILVLTRPIVPAWLIIPRVYNWRFLWLLYFNLHEITILLCIPVLELLLAFFYKLRLLACQSNIRHG
ncbi:hypothetical protein ALC57_00106 [Trachymyrmex cornetzi]|uniref:Uncharacterized protein n=1 Tax=Trachymyrmex cornetzi TaxID=471704 RepID=A0A151K2X2_9HYME|nr:hypothetical protein ALC57_00106 [Trachymyrmex cornetzi]